MHQHPASHATSGTPHDSDCPAPARKEPARWSELVAQIVLPIGFAGSPDTSREAILCLQEVGPRGQTRLYLADEDPQNQSAPGVMRIAQKPQAFPDSYEHRVIAGLPAFLQGLQPGVASDVDRVADGRYRLITLLRAAQLLNAQRLERHRPKNHQDTAQDEDARDEDARIEAVLQQAVHIGRRIRRWDVEMQAHIARARTEALVRLGLNRDEAMMEPCVRATTAGAVKAVTVAAVPAGYH